MMDDDESFDKIPIAKSEILTTINADRNDWKFVYDLRFSQDHIRVSSDNYVPSEKMSRNWFISHYHQFRIILLDDVRAGYVQKDGKAVHISILFGYRGRGIGTRILKEETGVTTVMSNNHYALETFQKAGWKVCGWVVKKT